MLSRITALALLVSLFPVTSAAGRITEKQRKVDAAMNEARRALFLRSAPSEARVAAARAAELAPNNAQALFLIMETAALQADTAAELDAALRLVSLKGAAERDPRTMIAAARILDLAANTSQFRPLIPRIQRLLAAGTSHASFLRAALIAAAQDGVGGLSIVKLAHEAGLITDWRLAGPFGKYSNVDFDRPWAPERDRLANDSSAGMIVEQASCEDGNFYLPDYFERKGVFYAAANFYMAGAGDRIMRLESAGTAAVFIDGKAVLTKDDRFHATGEIAAAPLHLRRGTHTVLVKFIPSALPFRLALLPNTAATESASFHVGQAGADVGTRAELAYVSAAKKYWGGEYASAIAELKGLDAQHPSAVADSLLAQVWAHVADNSPEESSALKAAARRAPEALAVQYELAQRARAAERSEEALNRLRTVLSGQPEFVPARELAAQMALNSPSAAGAGEAIDAAVRLHPSCPILRDALNFYNAHDDFSQAQLVEKPLQRCAPGSLAYAGVLSDRGDHAEAAQAARTVVQDQPLNRYARFVLVRELALAGAQNDAAREAGQLAAIAPNSERYRQLAAVPAAGLSGIFNQQTGRAREFTRREAFYAPFRRDALALVRQAAERKFSGGPAVTLLEERVARLAPGGSTAAYVHRITRVLNRDGIEQYGEVTLPAHAVILELRTIKADGSTAEPELKVEKSSISMPALSPEDAIDEEYVVYDDDQDGIGAHSENFRFTFGSFGAPILFSRFVVITPRDHKVEITTAGGAPQASERIHDDNRMQIWERNDIAQSSEESSMPRADVLPTVRILPGLATGWAEVRDHYRDLVIEATRAGSRTAELAARLAAASDEQRARELYRALSRIRPDRSSFASGDVTSAEETLASGGGSRTAVLLAGARAAGLRADLLLARDASSTRPNVAAVQAYARPLVMFHFAYRDLVVDAEIEGAAFGQLPATITTQDLLLVPAGPKDAAGPLIVAVQAASRAEQSVASADVAFDSDGNLTADIEIRFGATRSAQMRSVLAGIAPGERQRFFEQLAMRIFSGVTQASGEIRNEADTDQALEFVVECRAPNFLNVTAGWRDIDQLAPALGLRKMYAGANLRRFPLYIDTPLFESTRFRVRFPSNVHIAQLAPDANYNTLFGAYSLFFRSTGDTLEIRREFDIPVQVITPGVYSGFGDFAARIEQAERQRIGLQVEPAAQALAQEAR